VDEEDDEEVPDEAVCPGEASALKEENDKAKLKIENLRKAKRIRILSMLQEGNRSRLDVVRH
jgi:hypothetical protein